jgi:hypothetical protein
MTLRIKHVVQDISFRRMGLCFWLAQAATLAEFIKNISNPKT